MITQSFPMPLITHPVVLAQSEMAAVTTAEASFLERHVLATHAGA
jgi:hypothetical protein